MGKDKTSKRGKANDKAWAAAKNAVKSKNGKSDGWRRELWQEIRHQLRHRGDRVDMSAVPVHWTTESTQMNRLCAVLEKAGFKKRKHVYHWQD
jgi:hypothetical protein